MTERTKDALDGVDQPEQDLEATLYARHVEVESLEQLQGQRGTPIPALFNQFYKFIQNPSTVSIETFKRMVDTDDTVGSGVDFLTTCLAARLGRYQHKSREVTEWVNARLEDIDGGWFNVVKEILSATWAGFYVGEKVWANTEHGFVLKKVVPLPPSTLLFETNWSGELTEDGILQYQRNYNPAMLGQGMGFNGGGSTGLGFTTDMSRPDRYAKLGDLPFPMRTANTFNYLSIRIPRMKAIHYAFDAQGKFGNPYGRSLLRRAYKYYVMKDAFLQMLATALDRKGTPLTIVYADPNATIIDSSKNDGTGSAKGKSQGIRADRAAKIAFQNIHNDSTIILPGKKGSIFEVEPIEQSANQDAFIAALDFCNKSILRALLIPTLIFGNGDGTGSFALGQEHAKTFDKILDGMLSGVKQAILQQVIQEMVAYNFPKEIWQEHGYGDFGKRELSIDERNKEAEMVEKAVNIGAVDMDDLNDLNKIRETFGFEERDEPIAKAPALDEFGNPMEPGEDGENPFGAEGEEPGAGAPPKAKENEKESGKANPFKKLMKRWSKT